MDFRKLHVIIGELELDNIKLASKGDKQALNILALTQAFRIIEHKYRKGTECINCGSKNTQIEIICNDCANIEPRDGIDFDLKNGKLPIPYVNGWLLIWDSQPNKGQEICYEGNLGEARAEFSHVNQDGLGIAITKGGHIDKFERWKACR